MSIALNGRVVADPAFHSLSGTPAAGGYCLQLSIGLRVQNWTQAEGTAPVVRFRDSKVVLEGGAGLLLGYARPETTVPFRVFPHAHSTAFIYSLLLTPQALEAIESKRAGGGVVLLLTVQAELTNGPNVDAVAEDVRCNVSQSDWLKVLEATGYGRALLFEVPIPSALGEEAVDIESSLATAKRAFVEGRYTDSVSACRIVLEGLTKYLGQVEEMQRVRSTAGPSKRDLSVSERELLLRASAINYAHPAHHLADAASNSTYDRPSAQMMLGITASLVSAAFGRLVAS